MSGYSYSLGGRERRRRVDLRRGWTGVYLAGGTVVDDGIIEGGAYGVAVDQGNVVNTGTIAGFAGTGFGVGVDGTYVDDAGLIVGGEYGVTLYHGVVFNSGVIDGNVGVIIDQGTVADAGLIASRYGGYGDAVVLQSAYTVLKLLPGAAIEGIVLGAGGTLLLGAGDGAVGRLSGLGSQFLEFGAIEIRASADWTLAGGNSFDGTLLVDGTLVDAGRLTIDPDGVLDNAGVVAVRGTLVDQSAGLEIGSVEIGRGGTLDLAGTLSAGQSVLGVVTFEASAGLLEIGPGETFAGSIGAFRLGDTIDLAGIGFVAGAETASYQDGRLVLTGAGETLASFAAFGIPAGAGFAATADGHGGTEIIARPFGLTSLVDGVASAQAQSFAAGFAALARDVAATQGVANPGVDVFTPAALGVPGGGTAFDTIPVPGYVDVANGAPTVAEQSVTLGLHTQALVLAGSTDASLLGHAANRYAATEMLVGNAGNDTIRGGGGAGTILSGSGANQIHTGPGSMLVSSGGSDLIDTGSGNDTVDAYGAATVFAGAGTTTFADLGTASGADKVRAGSGTTVMRSGLGNDTFIGGSGSSQMIDSGPGHVAFQFNQGAGGNDVVTGFDAAAGDYVRVTGDSFGARAILGLRRSRPAAPMSNWATAPGSNSSA